MNDSFFTKIALVEAYSNVLGALEDVLNTAVTTRFSSFEMLCTLVGLRSAAQISQWFILHKCHGLPFAFLYRDDILVAICNPQKRPQRQRIIFSRFKLFELIICVTEYAFAAPTLKFLGHVVPAAGIRSVESKVKAIVVFFQPTSLRKLRKFLRLITFRRNYIPHCTQLLRPLADVLKGFPR